MASGTSKESFKTWQDDKQKIVNQFLLQKNENENENESQERYRNVIQAWS